MHILFLEPFLSPILFMFAIIVLLGGFFLLQSIYKKEKDFEKKRETEFNDYEKVLQKAHTNAEEIIHKAADEASHLTNEGKDFSQQINQQVDTSFTKIVKNNTISLQNTADTFLQIYETSLNKVKNTYENEMITILQKIQEDTRNDFSQMQEKIQQKTIDTQTGLIKQIEDDFTKAQMEIKEYKKHKLQEINQNMAKLIMRISEEVLGQAIPIQQHQQLIADALEKAQKEGMFAT